MTAQLLATSCKRLSGLLKDPGYRLELLGTVKIGKKCLSNLDGLMYPIAWIVTRAAGIRRCCVILCSCGTSAAMCVLAR